MYRRSIDDLWPGAYARPWALFHVGGRVGRSLDYDVSIRLDLGRFE